MRNHRQYLPPLVWAIMLVIGGLILGFALVGIIT